MDNEDNEVEIFEKSDQDDVLKSIYSAFHKGKITALLFACLCVVLAISVTTSPFNKYRFSDKTSLDDLRSTRPVLSTEVVIDIRNKVKLAETSFLLPSRDHIKLRYYSQVTKHGNVHPPQILFGGVTFGISAVNSHNLEYTAQSTLTNDNLLAALKTMRPQPSFVTPRHTQDNASGWSEDGFLVHFSYASLEQQGKLSDEPQQPWKRVLEDVVNLSRQYRQVYVTFWYPYTFGPVSNSPEEWNKNVVLIQQVEPTRTGLGYVRSKVAVWMSSLNHSVPDINPSYVYRLSQNE